MLQEIGIGNLYTSTYHPQTNIQTERYNCTIVAVIHFYVYYHQPDWYKYVSVLIYAYNKAVHRITETI